MFLEQPNHIPEEYHKYFGIQPIISSPRSESNTLVTNPEDDENSNSMMSANSEKEGLGAQMVLEQNLGNTLELVSKELNHLAAILHVYAGGLNFMK